MGAPRILLRGTSGQLPDLQCLPSHLAVQMMTSEPNVTVYVAPSEKAVEALTVPIDISVEAEYGSRVVEGRLYTAAHHQPEGVYSRFEQPAPCNNPEIPVLTSGVILLSHTDLDSIGGAMRAMGMDAFSPPRDRFWDLVEFIDLNGYHKLHTIRNLHWDTVVQHAAFMAFTAKRPYWPQDEPTDITWYINECAAGLLRIFQGETVLMLAGHKWIDERGRRMNETLVANYGGIEYREARNKDEYVNDLYLPGSKAIVGYNHEKGSITVSTPHEVAGFNCRHFVQTWNWIDENGTPISNTLAGGHDQCAGSPRGYRFSRETALEIHEALVAKFMTKPQPVST